MPEDRRGSNAGETQLVYSVPEAAAAMGVSSDKIYQLTRAGTLPHVRLGRRILIPKRSLDAWLEQAAMSEWRSSDGA